MQALLRPLSIHYGLYMLICSFFHFHMRYWYFSKSEVFKTSLCKKTVCNHGPLCILYYFKFYTPSSWVTAIKLLPRCRSANAFCDHHKLTGKKLHVELCIFIILITYYGENSALLKMKHVLKIPVCTFLPKAWSFCFIFFFIFDNDLKCLGCIKF